MGSSTKPNQNRTAKAAQAVTARQIACGEIAVGNRNPLRSDRPRGLRKNASVAELELALEKAFVSLTGQTSIERVNGMTAPDLRGRRRKYARAVLGSVFEKAEVADAVAEYLHREAEMTTTRFWPAIQLVRDYIENHPQVEDHDLTSVIDQALSRLLRATTFDLAASSVNCQLLGNQVQWVALDNPGDPDDNSLAGTFATKRHDSRALAEVLAMRQHALQDTTLHPHLYQLRMKCVRIARGLDFDQASQTELATAYWNLERAIDTITGPIIPSVQAELRKRNEKVVLNIWLGETAAERASGLVIPNRTGRAIVLRDLAQTSPSPAVALKRLNDARPQAETVVDLQWTAIEVVAEELIRHGYLTGDRMRELIAKVAPDAGQLSA